MSQTECTTCPKDIQLETEEQLNKALEVLHVERNGVSQAYQRQSVTIDQAKKDALKEIATFGLTSKEGLFRTQITVTDESGKRLYHIQDNLIGENLQDTDPRIYQDMLQKKSGELIRRSGIDYHYLGGRDSEPRHTLWKYAYFEPWQWYVLVEGHWYPGAIRE